MYIPDREEDKPKSTQPYRSKHSVTESRMGEKGTTSPTAPRGTAHHIRTVQSGEGGGPDRGSEESPRVNKPNIRTTARRYKQQEQESNHYTRGKKALTPKGATL
jgi:hypothetical protein